MKKINILLIIGVLLSYGCSKELDENSIRNTAQGEVVYRLTFDNKDQLNSFKKKIENSKLKK